MILKVPARSTSEYLVRIQLGTSQSRVPNRFRRTAIQRREEKRREEKRREEKRREEKRREE
eukprot:SAG31_NODE_39489_length_287_cov_8.664894_1_plen_60_part_10